MLRHHHNEDVSCLLHCQQPFTKQGVHAKLALNFFVQIILLCHDQYQNIEDWILALGVLVFVIIDIILLFLYTIITESIGESMVIPVLNRDNPRTVTGVSPFPKCHKQLDRSSIESS